MADIHSDIEVKTFQDDELKRRTVIVPMSCGNPYFSGERLTNLFQRLSELYPNYTFSILPLDGPARHNFEAMGMPVGEIPSYQRKRGNQLRNFAQHAMLRFAGSLKFEIEDWSKIYDEMSFSFWNQTLQGLYQTDANFRQMIREATEEYLQSLKRHPKWHKYRESSNSVDIAVNYPLEELAYFLMQSMLGHVTIVYHRPWPVLEALIKGRYFLRNMSSLKFTEIAVSENGDMTQVTDLEEIHLPS